MSGVNTKQINKVLSKMLCVVVNAIAHCCCAKNNAAITRILIDAITALIVTKPYKKDCLKGGLTGAVVII